MSFLVAITFSMLIGNAIAYLIKVVINWPQSRSETATLGVFLVVVSLFLIIRYGIIFKCSSYCSVSSQCEIRGNAYVLSDMFLFRIPHVSLDIVDPDTGIIANNIPCIVKENGDFTARHTELPAKQKLYDFKFYMSLFGRRWKLHECQKEYTGPEVAHDIYRIIISFPQDNAVNVKSTLHVKGVSHLGYGWNHYIVTQDLSVLSKFINGGKPTFDNRSTFEVLCCLKTQGAEYALRVLATKHEYKDGDLLEEFPDDAVCSNLVFVTTRSSSNIGAN